MEDLNANRKVASTLHRIDPQKLKVSIIISLSIIFVSALLLLISYNQIYGKIERNEMKLLDMKINENLEILNRRLCEYNQTLYLLSKDEDLFWIKNWNSYDDSEKLSHYNRAVRRIKNLKVSDDNIINIYACYPRQRIVLADGIYNIDKYDVLSEEQRRNISSPYRNVFFTSTYKDNVDIHSVLLANMISSDPEKVGFVVIQLAPSLITDVFSSINSWESGSFYVTDNYNNIVYTNGQFDISEWQNLLTNLNDENIAVLGNKKYYVVDGMVEFTQWKCYMAIPKTSIINGNWNFSGTVVLVALMVVIAIILGIIITQYGFSPLERLYFSVSKLKLKPKQPDRVAYLSKVFEQIISENNYLNSLAEQNRSMMQSKVLMQIVMQSTYNVKEIKQQLEKLGVKLEEKWFRIAIVSYHYDKDSKIVTDDMFTQFWQNKLNETRTTFYIVLFQPNTFFIVINYSDGKNDDEWRNWFNKQISEVKSQYNCTVTGGISQQKERLDELNCAFLEAYQIFEQQLLREPGCLATYTEKIVTNELKVRVPFELMENLINAVKYEDDDCISKILSNIREFFTQNPPHNKFVMQQIFLYMAGSFQQLIEEINNDKSMNSHIELSINRFRLANNISSYMTAFDSYVWYIRQAYKEYVASYDIRLYNQIVKFIEENYASFITPEEVADHFHISVSYLYKLFRLFMNDSPYRFLTTIRLNKAAYLLKSSSLSAKEIAKLCGIDNEQCFYRNFKKKYGCTPTQYRMQYLNSEYPLYAGS